MRISRGDCLYLYLLPKKMPLNLGGINSPHPRMCGLPQITCFLLHYSPGPQFSLKSKLRALNSLSHLIAVSVKALRSCKTVGTSCAEIKDYCQINQLHKKNTKSILVRTILLLCMLTMEEEYVNQA